MFIINYFHYCSTSSFFLNKTNLRQCRTLSNTLSFAGIIFLLTAFFYFFNCILSFTIDCFCFLRWQVWLEKELCSLAGRLFVESYLVSSIFSFVVAADGSQQQLKVELQIDEVEMLISFLLVKQTSTV